MADYREISQEYAKEGIRTCVLLNAGAAVTLLSQAAELIKAQLASEIKTAMLMWMVGTAVGTLIWAITFVSTRYVDKFEREKVAAHIVVANWLMTAGLVAFLISLACFVGGCIALAVGIGSLP